MTSPSPPLTPTFRPQLQINIPTWTISTPSFSPLSPSFTPVERSTRSLLQYTMEMLPDHLLSPSSWRKKHPFNDASSSPMTLTFLVEETNVTVEVTGYANGQFVLRLLAQQNSFGEEKMTPLVAVSILGHECFGEKFDVPAWKVRESLMERIGWHQGLD